MARKAKVKVPSEILFTANVPVNITVKHDGTHWSVAKVVVQDSDVDLDPTHVRAYDPVNDVELTRTIDAPEHPRLSAWLCRPPSRRWKRIGRPGSSAIEKRHAPLTAVEGACGVRSIPLPGES